MTSGLSGRQSVRSEVKVKDTSKLSHLGLPRMSSSNFCPDVSFGGALGFCRLDPGPVASPKGFLGFSNSLGKLVD